MPDLPTGTVTFLFTDIEGSTRLIQELRDRYPEALETHRRLLREAIRQAGGYEFETQGDGLFSAFPNATNALKAAITAQRALHEYPWPEAGAVRVRMGLHTGQPTLTESGYVGLDLHRTARICTAGHGGQILLSQTTRDLVEDDLPENLSLRDLGEHRLKDLTRPQRLFQVLVADLPSDFPPLQSLDVLPNNLPIQLTSFIGREREIAEVKRLLSTTRLLALTGTGGVGKTRLAIQVAAQVLDEFKDGVWLVELASLSDPALVPQSVASALGVREQPDRPISATLTDYLQRKQLLLLLDNAEHLIEACAELADAILRACPDVQIMATSREGLGIAGETVWAVPPLSLPDPRRLPPVDRLTEFEAVGLFVERAKAVLSTFKLSDQSALAVARVCHQLDGLPLAVELAAARVKVLSVEQILSRLGDRFRLLTVGRRVTLPRHQMLGAAIDWSFDLLSEKERTLFRRASVLRGSWTLEDAEAVSAGGSVEAQEVLDLLTHLVDKSLVVVEPRHGGNRYRFLETIREYGQNRLVESGEVEDVRRRHRDWFLGLAEQMELKRWGPDQRVGLERLEAEHDNLRAALEWSLAGVGMEAAVRLAAALGWFWHIRGYWSEGREWLDAALSVNESSDPYHRARALFWAGRLAHTQQDHMAARPLYEESLAIFRELGSKRELAVLLEDLAFMERDYAAARSMYQESLSLWRELGIREGVGWVLPHLGRVARDQGDLRAARSFCEEGLALCRELDYRRGISFACGTLASVEESQGNYPAAHSLRDESLEIARELGDKGAIADALIALANLVRDQGDYITARPMFEESLAIFRELGTRTGTAWALRGLGTIGRLRGDHTAARPLYEVSLAIFRELGRKHGIGWVLYSLGSLSRQQGDHVEARPLCEESLAMFRELGHMEGLGYALSALGEVERLQNHHGRAVARLAEALNLPGVISYKPLVVACLEGFARLAAAKGKLHRTARLFAVAMTARDAMGTPLPPSDRVNYDLNITATRTGLGEEAFGTTWAEGQAMTLEQAIEYALSEDG